MQDRPTAAELLEAIGDLLEGPVMDATGGGLKHQVRVAGNLCRILEREAKLGPGQEAQATQRLAELLGEDAAACGSRDLDALLAERLRSGGEGRDFEARAFAVVLEIVRGKLAISKPGHDGYAFDAETEA